ncbi:MAG TPA: hypothetical protein VHO24_20070 [Opitutaceae bacterium]|nr:hypothetical protein [Opitutaceae bacterium]
MLSLNKPPRSRFPVAAALLLLVWGGPAALTPLAAKSSEWKDLQGTQFKAEPAQVFGPFALFKTGNNTGRRVLLRGLSPEDCVRFYRETASRPPRARSWAQAKGVATREVIGRALRVQGDKLVPADLTAIPEPEILILLFGSNNDGGSWRAVGDLSAIYRRFQRVAPGRVEILFVGVRHDQLQHKRIACDTKMPWLVADFQMQPSLGDLVRHAPGEGSALVALSREGVPLVSGSTGTTEEVAKLADKLRELFGALEIDNQRGWPDRYRYEHFVRPLAHAEGGTGPLLIGNPLRADGLREYEVARIEAKLAVAADGSVTEVTLQPGSILPAAMAEPVTAALRKAPFAPAIENGRAVAGTFDYVFVVPPANVQAEADVAWANGDARKEIPLASWLVLKPIHVEENNFLGVDRVEESGTVVLKAVGVAGTVTRKAQMNAFNSDWFAAAGADSVRPVQGATQIVDGLELKWTRVTPAGELVNFQKGTENVNYSVGYAWTEFDAPADMEAWLGLGSDDGVKIWHNGVLVNDQWVRRPSRLDDDVVPLRLTKGKNRLLIKIQNVTGGWSFICRVRTR